METMETNELREVYISMRPDYATWRDLNNYINSHWPTGSKPWDSATWSAWRREKVGMSWAARTAMHRIVGIEDPPYEVAISGFPALEVVNVTKAPRGVIVVGNETRSVSLRTEEPSDSGVAAPATKSLVDRVKVLGQAPSRRRAPRHNISLYDMSTFEAAQSVKKSLGMSWEEFVRAATELLRHGD